MLRKGTKMVSRWYTTPKVFKLEGVKEVSEAFMTKGVDSRKYKPVESGIPVRAKRNKHLNQTRHTTQNDGQKV